MRNRTLLALIPILGAGQAFADPPAERAAVGQQLYQAECSDCHLPDGTGDAGPDIRGLGKSAVSRALRGFDEMPEFEFSKEQVAALVAYLAVLNTR